MIFLKRIAINLLSSTFELMLTKVWVVTLSQFRILEVAPWVKFAKEAKPRLEVCQSSTIWFSILIIGWRYFFQGVKLSYVITLRWKCLYMAIFKLKTSKTLTRIKFPLTSSNYVQLYLHIRGEQITQNIYFCIGGLTTEYERIDGYRVPLYSSQ